MGQYVEIDSDWRTPVFHCPVCGRKVFTRKGRPASRPCEHVLFSWINQVSEFYNAATEIQPLLKDEESRHSPASEAFLKRCPKTAVLFSFASYEMGCGPLSLKIIHAIRFLEDTDEDEDI